MSTTMTGNTEHYRTVHTDQWGRCRQISHDGTQEHAAEIIGQAMDEATTLSLPSAVVFIPVDVVGRASAHVITFETYGQALTFAGEALGSQEERTEVVVALPGTERPFR